MFEDVIKESQGNESVDSQADFHTKSIQALSKPSLWDPSALQSLAHLQVTDEAQKEEKELAKINVEAWDQDGADQKAHVKHLKVSRFSFGTVQNEQIDYEKLARHRESVHPNQAYQVLEYEPSQLLATASRLSLAGVGGHERGEIESVASQVNRMR